MTPSERIAKKIADAAIRRAVGLSVTLDGLPDSIRGAAEKAVEELATGLVSLDDKGILRCSLCGKGPFTRKGLYLHIKRVHMDLVVSMAKKLFEEKIWSAKAEMTLRT